MSIEAAFESTCIDCDERIHEGDRIQLVENRGWVHETCPDPLKQRRAICKTCFCEIPCYCEPDA